MSLTDPARVIVAMPPGSCLHARVAIDGAGMETAIMLREQSARIAALGPGPRVELRVGVIEEQGVGLVPLLLRLGPRRQDGSDVWECWVNIHAEGDQALMDFARQECVVLLLYGDRPGDPPTHERAIRVPNALRDNFARIAETVDALHPWTMQQFDAARERAYGRYPTPSALWEGMDS